MKRIKAKGGRKQSYMNCPWKPVAISFGVFIINDLEKFKRQSNAIIANRHDRCFDDVEEKVYTRDLFRGK